MSIRIIGGTHRGRVIKSPKSSLIRPTTAVLRKSVFDICKGFIEDARFLDLFAGSGAIGIEALSRGASHVTFVDQEKNALRGIEENLRTLKLEDQATLIRGDAPNVLNKLESFKKKFDIIYIDPPYGQNERHPELMTLLDTLALAAGAIIFVEEAFPTPWVKETIPLKHFVCKDRRRFGRSILHQYIPINF
jgi:16S rRNA (guanine966-N2)-methyltransferase